MIDLFAWLVICFWVLMLIRIEWNHRIDNKALDLIHDQNQAQIDAWINAKRHITDKQLDGLLGRYGIVDGYTWKNLLDLTSWTLRQRYPHIVEWEGEHGE